MAFAGERKDADVAAALEERKVTDELEKVFLIIDRENSGYIEQDVERFLQNFESNARELNAAEVKASLQVGETDGERKIRAEDLVRK